MTFKDSVRTVLREKYATIEGRAPRSEYWWFFLFYLLVSFALGPVDLALFGDQTVSPLGTIFGVLVLIPFVTVGVRRLHDRDMSGWWYLLILIPLIGSLALAVIFMIPGTVGTNRFGPDPLGSSSGSDGDDTDLGLSQSSIPRVGRDD